MKLGILLVAGLLLTTALAVTPTGAALRCEFEHQRFGVTCVEEAHEVCIDGFCTSTIRICAEIGWGGC